VLRSNDSTPRSHDAAGARVPARKVQVTTIVAGVPTTKPRFAVSMITPFDSSGAVDEDALRSHLHRIADAGLEMWLVSSGTGEANVLSDAEVDRIVEIAVAEVGDRARVFAMGCEPRSAPQEIAWANRMADLGIQAVQIGPLEPGHSYRPTDDDLRSFYDDVLAGVSVPCYLASHMSVGYQVPPRILADAARAHEHAAGFAICHLDNFPYVTRLLSLADGKPVLLGSPFQTLEGLACGAAGTISSMDAFVAPHLYGQLADAWVAGDLDGVVGSFSTAVGLFNRIFAAGGLVVLKAVLDQLGLRGGPPRAPRQPASERVLKMAAAIVADYGLVP
jgi:4-hydroxy-tetrahydrodipicolinate synthase